MEGYEVLSAADGPEALRLFAEHSVDLVLLGLSYARYGRWCRRPENEERTTARTHIIIVSASQQGREVLCVDDFIEKGNGPAFLLARVKQLLSSRTI